MHKIAFFVEGQTELIFLEYLIEYVAEHHNFTFTKKHFPNKENDQGKKMLILQLNKNNSELYIQIIECQGEGAVISQIMEKYPNLIKQNFQMILAIRDVDPIPRNKIEELQKNIINAVMSHQSNIEFVLILAKMETEAWFLADYKHFQKINPKLTPEFILQERGYDPKNFDFELLDKPSKELDEIYKLAGYSYSKKEKRVTRTIKSLDYSHLQKNLSNQYQSLNILINTIDNCLSR